MKKTEWVVLEDEQIAEANAEPFVILYDRYFNRIYNYIRYRCFDAAATDDLTAQVFLKALINIKKYDPKKAPFDAWLFSISRNLINDFYRSKKKYNFVNIEDVEHILVRSNRPLEEISENKDEKHRLLSKLETLLPRHRDIIALKFGAGMTNRKIAQLTGLTAQNVGVILHRGINKLRKLMEEEERE